MEKTVRTDSPAEIPPEKSTLFTRRGFLKAGAAAATLVAIEASGCAPAAGPPSPSPTVKPSASPTIPSPTAAPTTPAATVPADAYVFFNQTEAGTVRAVVGRLLPGNTQDPGAVEAGAHLYIDRALGGPYSLQQTGYRRGLASLNAYSRDKGGKNFADLTPDIQDGILTDMQKGTATGFFAPAAAAFFNTLLQHTREGTFCDPVYGGNRGLIGWKMVGFPGAQMGYGDDDMTPGADQSKKNILTLAETESILMPSPQSGF
jgi:gluconate 2-dehydrogenase gamma chain